MLSCRERVRCHRLPQSLSRANWEHRSGLKHVLTAWHLRDPVPPPPPPPPAELQRPLYAFSLSVCCTVLTCELPFTSFSEVQSGVVRCSCGVVKTRPALTKHIFFLRTRQEETAHLHHALKLRELFKDVVVQREVLPAGMTT